MIVLPIAERELRVNSRKRGTFWLRPLAAGLALITAAAYALVLSRSMSPAMVGTQLFNILTWTAFLGALGAGLFFTSDAISEEKREGTLGLLFLTDLRGYDVVSGKLLAAALRGVYALLAAFPIIGITLMMGGVTGWAFLKASLALLNALVASLVAGLFVSSISRDSQKALSATVLALALWLGVGLAVDAAMQPMQRFFAYSSPAYLFWSAVSGNAGFGTGLVVNQAITWILFALTCHFAAETWRDRPAAPQNRVEAVDRWLKFGEQAWREKLRHKLLDMNPVCWLTCRQRWQAGLLWVIAALLMIDLAIAYYMNDRSWWQVSLVAAAAVRFLLYLAAATHAGRFMADARRNGLLELFLATPVTPRQIIAGQWLAFFRMFALPLGFILATQLASNFLFQLTVTGGATPLRTVTDTLLVLAHLTAMGWFGMWMGLTSKNINAAAWKTLLFVQVLPWFVATFAQFTIFRLANPMWVSLLAQYVSLALYLAKDIFFILWSRRKLYAEFRERAASRFGT